MRKILFVVLGEISTGELSIAVSFQNKLDKDKYTCDFLIPKDKLPVIGAYSKGEIITVSRDNTLLENRKFITTLIQSRHYDLLLLFDIFTFEYACDWTGVDTELVKKLHIPIVSLDEYEYTKAGYQLDYYGLFLKKLPPLLHKCDFIIKNCPLTMMAGDNCFRQGIRGNEYYYRVFDRLEKINKEERASIRSKYIKNENAKIVFFTTSMWEFKGAYSFAAQNRLVNWLGIMLFEYLKALDEEIILLHVGCGDWNLPEKDGRLSYIHYDGFPVEEFEKILQAADLYVTFNLVSITLSKAVMFGIPSLVFNNSKILDYKRLSSKLPEMSSWYQKMALDVKKVYPFAASMFGWSQFLQTVLRDNSYLDTFERTEFFIPNKVLESLRNLLSDEGKREELIHKGRVFLEEYDKLPDAEKILKDIFDRLDEVENKPWNQNLGESIILG